MFSKKIKVYKTGTTINGEQFLLGRLCGKEENDNMIFFTTSENLPFIIKDNIAKISIFKLLSIKKYNFMDAMQQYYQTTII